MVGIGMNVLDAMLWGLMATIILTSVGALAHGMGLSRMSIVMLLGTMFTPDRSRAKLLGLGLHLLFGWIFAFLYAGVFESLGWATWWLGAATGLVHAAFVTGVVMPSLPAAHPRMAREDEGPTMVRRLQPPGFLALHYGVRTPVVSAVAHILYGLVLGAFYTPVA
jgi:uncharacterized membrane protein YagU involved in acid resistance